MIRHQEAGAEGADHLHLVNLLEGTHVIAGHAAHGLTMSAPVAGAPNRFNLLSGSVVSQFEITKVDGRYEMQLTNEGQAKSNSGFATNTGGLSADGLKWIDGSRVLRILDMPSLDIRERSFEPARTSIACPAADPDQVILSLARSSGDGVHSLVDSAR